MLEWPPTDKSSTILTQKAIFYISYKPKPILNNWITPSIYLMCLFNPKTSIIRIFFSKKESTNTKIKSKLSSKGSTLNWKICNLTKKELAKQVNKYYFSIINSINIPSPLNLSPSSFNLYNYWRIIYTCGNRRMF